MKSFAQLARVMYVAFVDSAREQKKAKPSLWLRDQPSWEALNPEMQTCWIAAARSAADEVKHLH